MDRLQKSFGSRLSFSAQSQRPQHDTRVKPESEQPNNRCTSITIYPLVGITFVCACFTTRATTMKLLLFTSFLPAAVLAFAPPVPMVKSTTSNHNVLGVVRCETQLYAAADSANIIIAGAPASGKGTQCEVIKEKFGVVHLSTGDMLRAAVAAQTDVGKKAKDFMDSGKLVPDDVIIGVVRLQGDMNNYVS